MAITNDPSPFQRHTDPDHPAVKFARHGVTTKDQGTVEIETSKPEPEAPKATKPAKKAE